MFMIASHGIEDQTHNQTVNSAKLHLSEGSASMKSALILAPLLLVGCTTERSGYRLYAAGICPGSNTECLNRLAEARCPNGANDYDAYRDERGLWFAVGCD